MSRNAAPITLPDSIVQQLNDLVDLMQTLGYQLPKADEARLNVHRDRAADLVASANALRADFEADLARFGAVLDRVATLDGSKKVNGSGLHGIDRKARELKNYLAQGIRALAAIPERVQGMTIWERTEGMPYLLRQEFKQFADKMHRQYLETTIQEILHRMVSVRDSVSAQP